MQLVVVVAHQNNMHGRPSSTSDSLYVNGIAPYERPRVVTRRHTD